MEFKLDTSESFPFKHRTNKPFNPEHLELDDEILLASFYYREEIQSKGRRYIGPTCMRVLC